MFYKTRILKTPQKIIIQFIIFTQNTTAAHRRHHHDGKGSNATATQYLDTQHLQQFKHPN
jgi:hypothetical protein